MDLVKIGENIKKYREEMDVTQVELGKMIGVSNQVISNWERGKDKAARLVVLNKIAEALGIDIRDLIGWEHALTKKKAEDKERICMLLTPVLRECRAYPDLKFLHYTKSEDGEEVIVTVEDPTGCCDPTFIRVDVTADSGIAMIKDIIAALG